MKMLLKTTIVAAFAALATMAMPLVAQARDHDGGGHRGGGGWHGGGGHGGGWHGGGYHGGGWDHDGWRGGSWGPGPFWGGLGLGLGLGAITYYGAYGPSYYDYGYAPGYVVSPDPGYVEVQPTPLPALSQPMPSVAGAPEPIFYPKNGQSAARTETDRRDCNRWATTQNGAMADASIFQRATLACMEGRGYTAR